MKVASEVHGQMPDNREAILFTVTNNNGLVLKISNYGGIIQSIQVPDREGVLADVVLGFDEFKDYLKDHPYIGTIVGRYANRIAGGSFKLDGSQYKLVKNNGANHLHGGLIGFDKVLWEASEFADKNGAGVMLTYLSHHMEEGYPGNLKVRISITLNDDNQVCLDYQATTDKTTVLNLTHHGYFNLNGGINPVYDHLLTIHSGTYVISNADLIPTGEIGNVADTPLDFRIPKLIGKDIDNVPGGFDHCYTLEGGGQNPYSAARVVHPESGRVMEVFTTEPGLQFYSSNFLNEPTGKGGQAYGKHQAFCLEAQHYPDSPNHPGFPDTILRPGETYIQKTIYRFSAE